MIIQIPFYKVQEYGYQYKHVMTKLKYLSMENDNSIDVIFWVTVKERLPLIQ